MPGHQIEWGSVPRPAAATMVALMLLAGGTRANAQATTATLVGTVRAVVNPLLPIGGADGCWEGEPFTPLGG